MTGLSWDRLSLCPHGFHRRGFTSGQGNVVIGGNVGAISFLLTVRILIGAEFRWNVLEDSSGDFGTFGGKVGVLF
jgi:hypothetical protein